MSIYGSYILFKGIEVMVIICLAPVKRRMRNYIPGALRDSICFLSRKFAFPVCDYSYPLVTVFIFGFSAASYIEFILFVLFPWIDGKAEGLQVSCGCHLAFMMFFVSLADIRFYCHAIVFVITSGNITYENMYVCVLVSRNS